MNAPPTNTVPFNPLALLARSVASPRTKQRIYALRPRPLIATVGQ
jgi:hypothetical protein